jgi:hypothetical protein
MGENSRVSFVKIEGLGFKKTPGMTLSGIAPS